MIENTRDQIIFTCDKCDFEVHFPEYTYTFHTALEKLKNNGWKIKANRKGRSTYFNHYCKNCAEEV